MLKDKKGTNYGFDNPDAISSDGSHVWVANIETESPGGNSVTELDASTGALLRVLSASSYGFDDPDAISSDGTDVWVANGEGNSVTELDASTGALVQVLSASSYGFDDPGAISSDGADVWVANGAGNSVTELDASTGALVQVLSASSYRLRRPRRYLLRRHRRLGRQWREVTASRSCMPRPGARTSSSRVRVMDSTTPTLSRQTAPMSGSTNGARNSVTELDASTGALVQVITGSSYGFDDPDAVSSDGTHVWVVNGGGNSVTELDGSEPARSCRCCLPPAMTSITPTPSPRTAPMYGWPISKAAA